jgi:protein-tyrosine-phosphatase
MREKGIDLAGAKPKALAPAMADGADRVITMGCMDAGQCPSYLRGAVDWGLEDPSGKPIETVRRIRDEVERRVRALLEEMGAL